MGGLPLHDDCLWIEEAQLSIFSFDNNELNKMLFRMDIKKVTWTDEYARLAGKAWGPMIG